MAQKTLNTRIQLKYDTLENWSTNNPVLLAGEVAIVSIPAETEDSGFQSLPAIAFKVGDGTTNFNTLKYTQAIAGDVYAWAKAATKPTYTASEIQNLSDFISGEIQDTNTRYQLVAGTAPHSVKLQSSETGGAPWTDVGTEIAITYTLETGTTNGTVKFNGTDVAVFGLKSAAYADASSFDAAGSADAVKTELTGTAGDTSATLTLNGIKKFAQETASAAETSAKSYTDQQIAAKLSSTYKAAGSVEFDSLPELGASIEGNVYNVTNGFTTTANFVEGAGKTHPAGTNVVCIDVGTDEYKWDVLSGFVDLSSYATTSYVDSAKSDAISQAKSYTDSTVGALDTDDIDEGSTNLYYTEARATANFKTHASTELTDTAHILYDTDTFVINCGNSSIT